MLEAGVVDEDVDVGRQVGDRVEVRQVGGRRLDLPIAEPSGELLEPGLVPVHGDDDRAGEGQPTAIAAPIPLAAPVTSARCPVRSAGSAESGDDGGMTRRLRSGRSHSHVVSTHTYAG